MSTVEAPSVGALPAVPPMFNYTVDVVDAEAAAAPSAPALVAVDGDTVHRFTFAEASELAARAAAVFRAAGVVKGDRILVQLPRVHQWYWVVLGLLRIGAVPIPATTQLTAKDMAYRLGASDGRGVVTDLVGTEKYDTIADDCPAVTVRVSVGCGRPGWLGFDEALASADPDRAAPDTAADDPMLIYFTSGTTGLPKMVLHTHASVGIGHELTARHWHGLGPHDLHWTVADFGWAKASWGKLFGQWRSGAAVFLWNIVGSPDYHRMLQLIGEHRITSFCAPPTIYRVLAQMDLAAYDWSHLRHCTAAGEPLNPEVMRVWKDATGLDIYDGYGQTETVVLVANRRGTPIKPGSMGKPMPGMDVQIVDDEGAVVPRGTEGHLAVRTDPRPVGLFKEYWQAPERNAECFRNGWYYTGDRAFQDEDGYLWFVGRADDVILSAGYRIGPFEVESTLLEHAAVAESAVVGAPDEVRGEIVVAYVVLASGFETSETLASELQAFVKERTAPYKYPRRIEFVDELPKTVSGKIRRVELRERARS